MIKLARNKAEERFAATKKAQKQLLTEQNEKTLKQREKTARLKALRLEKEAEDAKVAATQKATPKKKRSPK